MKGKSIILNNIKYESLRAACDAFGITVKTVEMRRVRKWTDNECFGISPPPTRVSLNRCLRETKERKCPKCNEIKQYSEYYGHKSKNHGGINSWCRNCEMLYSRHRSRKEKFGLDEDAWNTLFELQGSKCDICGVMEHKLTWQTDHNHVTGKTRGILCADCNFLLGNAKDDTSILLSAIEYLVLNGK